MYLPVCTCQNFLKQLDSDWFMMECITTKSKVCMLSLKCNSWATVTG